MSEEIRNKILVRLNALKIESDRWNANTDVYMVRFKEGKLAEINSEIRFLEDLIKGE